MEAVRAVPMDHLMIETDAPYQSPITGKHHDPTDVIAIYRKIAELKGIVIKEDCLFLMRQSRTGSEMSRFFYLSHSVIKKADV